MLPVENIAVCIYGKEDKGKEEDDRMYSELRKSLRQREGRAAALFQLEQEDLELLKTMITRGGKVVGLCDDFEAFLR